MQTSPALLAYVGTYLLYTGFKYHPTYMIISYVRSAHKLVQYIIDVATGNKMKVLLEYNMLQTCYSISGIKMSLKL